MALERVSCVSGKAKFGRVSPGHLVMNFIFGRLGQVETAPSCWYS
jgi:hypothetical protein